MIYNLAVVYFWLAGLTGAWTGLIGRGPDSPAICSDTLGLWWSRCSGFRSGFSGLGSPDTPDFRSRVAHKPDRSYRFGIPI